MTLNFLHFEGTTLAATVSLTNGSTADSPLFQIFTTGFTLQYASSQAMHGTTSVKASPGGTAGTGSLVLGGSPLSSHPTAFTGTDTIFNQRAYFYFTGFPSSAIRIMEVRPPSAASIGGFNLNSNGTFAIAGPSATLQTATSALSLNTWYRFEQCWTVGSATGNVMAAVYAGDSGTPLASFPLYNGTVDTSSATALDRGYFGKVGSSQTLPLFYMDDLAVSNPATASLMGPYVPAPVINLVETVGIVTIDATGSVPGNGGTLTYSISPTTNVTASATAGIWRVTQTNVDQTFTVTITESGSARTATQTVTVPSAKQNVAMYHYTGTAWA